MEKGIVMCGTCKGSGTLNNTNKSLTGKTKSTLITCPICQGFGEYDIFDMHKKEIKRLRSIFKTLEHSLSGQGFSKSETTETISRIIKKARK